jgi:predicted RNase H-like HicB family nuclease
LTDANRYPANVFWSDEDEGFIAVAPDLPGCSAFGETQHEALTELQSAIAAWIEAARTAGNPIPEPSQPAADNVYSGKILVRMPKSLHAHLAQAAKAEAVSLNQHIVFLLTWATTTHHSTGLTAAGYVPTYTLTNFGVSGGFIAGTTGLTAAGYGPTYGLTGLAVSCGFIAGAAVSTASGLPSASHGMFLRRSDVVSTEYFGKAGAA